LLRGVSIRNFRGIRSSEIKDFNQINVFIGEFGSGKSTIFDAIYLMRLSADRDECLRRVLTRRTGRHPDLRSYWYRYAPEEASGLRYEFDSSTYHIQLQQHPQSPNHVVLNTSADTVSGNVEVTWELGGFGGNVAIGKEATFTRGITLLDARMLSNVLDSESRTLTPIKERRLEEELLHFLKKVFRTVRGFEFLGASPRRPGESRCSLSFDDARVQIDDVSDGVRNGLVILSTAFMLKSTALLLEEPENHMDPRSLDALLESLVDICRMNQLQLFVTTHRPEVLASLVGYGKELVTVFHFSRQDGEVRAKPSYWNDTRILIEMGWDIEKLVKGYEKYVVVEGRKDKLVLEQAFKKTKGVSPENLWITVISARGLDRNFNEIVKALLPTERQVFALPDLGNKLPDERVRQLADSVKTLASEGYQVSEKDGIVTVASEATKASLRLENIMPLGDPQGLEKMGLKFESFSMDDYLLEMILRNTNVWSELEIAEGDVERIKRSKISKLAINDLTVLTDERIETLFQACPLPQGLAEIIRTIAGETKTG